MILTNYLPWIISGSVLLVLIIVIILICTRKKYNFNSIPDMSGKTVVVTGSTSGIGYETAKELAKRNAYVILASRNEKKGADTIAKIKEEYPNALVEFIKLDTSSLESVKNFKDEICKRNILIDSLVLNAGIYKVPKRELSIDGNERQLATNYLGHFALVSHLLPYVKNEDSSSIVSVSSLSHSWSKLNLEDLNLTNSYKPTKAYAQSKLALLMFSYELQRRLENKGLNIRSIAVHPGISKTGIVRFGDRGTKFSQKLWSLGFSIVGQSQKKGALPTIYAVCESDAQAGKYYGPDMLFGSKGYPKLVHSSKYSKRIKEASILWEKSEELTNLKFDI